LTITPSCNLPEDYRKLAVGDLGRTAPGERRPLVRRADPRLPPTMRRNHVAGERMFVDHGWRNAGSGRSIHQRSADRQLFLAGLGHPLDPGLDRLDRRQIKASEEPDSTTAPALSAAIDLSSQPEKLRCYESFRVKDRAPTFE
jgi:hypothetical protein